MLFDKFNAKTAKCRSATCDTRLSKGGKSLRQIAEELGVHHSKVGRILQRQKIKGGDAEGR
jgi:IS30 family transposase